MFLKRLEVYGFKSFAEKTELTFTQGITAIVGPNGSGKSNVGDAVRWVLGEQSAKQLRGGKMEDIIFNGTEKRKKLSFCEVTLVFDNTNRTLPIDYSEVAITRRLYRSGESEYSINRAICRLKDVTELLMDTGIGKEGYSIIGQGKIDHILSNKAEERRGVFEEAAGIMKYKTKKLEAERRLERTCENIERLSDILTELSDRIEPLKGQSDTAQQYLAIRDDLRALEVNFYLYQYDMAAQKKAGIHETLVAVEGEYEEKEGLKGRLHLENEADVVELSEIEVKLEQVRKQVLELTQRIEKGTGESRLFSERVAHLNEDILRLQTELVQDESMKNTMLSAMAGDEEAVARKAVDIAAMGQEIAAMDASLVEQDQQLASESEALEAARNQMVNTLNRLSDVRVNLGRYEAMRTGISSRLQAIANQKAAQQHEQESIEVALTVQQETGATAVDEHQALFEQIKGKRVALTNIQSELSAARRNNEQSTAELQAAQQRAKMLREMKDDYESFNNSVKHILKEKDHNPQIASAMRGVVAQLLTVPKDYERAVETALGAAVQNIVTPTEEDAKYLIQYLKQGRFGRATFLPVSAIRGRRLDATERNATRVKGCFGIASELVSFDEAYREIFESLLGRTVICDTMDTCIAIARASRHRFRLVTLDGDVLNAGGSMTGGSSQSRLTSVLGRTRQLEEAEASAEALLVQCEAHKGAVGSLVDKRSAAEAELGKLEEQLHASEVRLARDKERTGKLEADLRANQEALEALYAEEAEHNDTLAEIASQLAGASGTQGDIEQSNKSEQADIAARTAEFNKRKLERERLAQRITDQKVQHSVLNQQLSVMHSNAQRAEKEIAAIQERKVNKNNQIAHFTQQIAAIDEESVSFSKQVDLLKQNLTVLEENQAALEQRKEKLSTQGRERERSLRGLEEDLLAAQEKKHKLELSIQKVDNDIALMEQRVWDEYELTYLSASDLRKEDFKPTGVQTEINRLRKEIGALGTVNVNAIEEYIATKERFEGLSTQMGDLQKAEQDLRRIIGDMVKKMEGRFAEQFAIINKYFGETFKQLFGGGRAELRLEDSQDILGSGIDIVAQPPGKSLQMLSLLSGGERALTAIAILFAMLRLKPTPFCILDEIEAALDEANVYNFADYLRVFTDKTQFIVITHRKPTMEEADSLYGVAMEEKGVSKMVSVRLSDAGA